MITKESLIFWTVSMILSLVDRIKKFVRDHGVVLLTIFVFTTLFFIPLFLFPQITKDTYRGINIIHYHSNSD